jgi:hypothetical protein
MDPRGDSVSSDSSGVEPTVRIDADPDYPRGTFTKASLAEIAQAIQKNPQLIWVAFHDIPINDELVAVVRELSQLESFIVHRGGNIDAKFGKFRECHRLRNLCIYGSPLSEISVIEIGQLRSLEQLSLCGEGVNDQTIKQLASLQNLERLELKNTALTPKGLSEILVLARLNDLDVLGSPAITDDDVFLVYCQLPRKINRYGYVKAYHDAFGNLGPYSRRVAPGLKSVENWKEQWDRMTDAERRNNPIGIAKEARSGEIIGGVFVSLDADFAYDEWMSAATAVAQALGSWRKGETTLAILQDFERDAVAKLRSFLGEIETPKVAIDSDDRLLEIVRSEARKILAGEDG